MVDLNWTYEQAAEAQEAYDKGRRATAKGPLSQWNTLHQLEKLKESFEAGSSFAMLHAVFLCVSYDLVVPAWAAKPFRRQYLKVLHYDLGSWDEAFGRPNPKGMKLALAKRSSLLKWKVRNEINKIRARENAPMDDGLFERVADLLKIGKRQCKQYWYSK